MTQTPASDAYARKRLADEALANPFTKSFVPKKKVAHRHGTTSIQVYPDSTTDMGDHEHCLAFNINKTAVNNAVNLNHTSKLQIMGEKHNSSNLIDIEVNQWVTTGMDDLRNNDNLVVISYHNNAGAVINNCLDNNGALKPIQDGPMADCRPDGIVFAKMKGDMNFLELNNNIAKTVSSTFFLRLPTTDNVVNNVALVPRTLHTFNGPSDWLEIQQDDYKSLIYDHEEAIHIPFDILPPAFASPSAVIDMDVKYGKIRNDIIKASYERILEQIFQQICPNFVDDPFATLNQVKQENTLENGSYHKSTVREYHDTFQIVLTTFPKDNDAVWSSNPFRKFMEGLSHDIKDKVEQNGFRKHMTSAPVKPHDQMRLIQEGFQSACLAETELAKQRTYIHATMQESHGFLVLPPVIDSKDDANPPAQALSSAAETTLSKFRDPKKKICWGCMMEDDHVYYDPKTKTITCPRGHEPEVVKRAAMVRDDFNKRRRSFRSSRDSKSKGPKSQSAIKNFLMTLDEPDILKIFNARAGTKTTTEKSDDKPATFCFLGVDHVCVFTSNNLPQLPIPINSTLPHIMLLLGAESSKFNPSMPAIIDTGAALCCGWSGYIMPIAEAYPELVKSITLAKDRYSPIVLSGVVSTDPEAKRYATNLPAVVEFHLPYLTHSNSPTSIKIAVGKDVSINLLLGMSFISAAKLVIDTNDDVVESKILDINPFKIDYRAPSRTAPNILPRNEPLGEKSLLVIEKIKEAQAFISEHLGGRPVEIETKAPISPPTVNFDKAIQIHNTITEQREIIRVPSAKYRKKKPNIFETENFPDPRDDFEWLQEKAVGRVIRKTTRPALTDADIDPQFAAQVFDKEKHQPLLDKYLKIGPNVSDIIRERVTDLVKEYWCCFCDENVKLPIVGYQCTIDTGNAKPRIAKNIRYGIQETPIIQAAIDSLLDNGHICVDEDSEWLSRIVLAAKPHQEDVIDIADFVWRMCISFIPLNQVTKIIAYYIPRCDDAVENGFGLAQYFFMMDACSGYHQIEMEQSASKKTAFAGPLGRKYRYLVMPFGVVNGPTVYVIMAFDQREYAIEECFLKFEFRVDENNNTTIIIDDLFGYSESPENALIILEAILIVSKRYRLSWKLKKCSFFPERVEFVGHDLTQKGNYPASSKDDLLTNWRTPSTVREISSFIGFGNFYSRYIPWFESRIKNMRKLITNNDYNRTLSPSEWTNKANEEFEDIRKAILSKPCLRRVSRSKRPYLRTDFSAIGMGWAILQPGDDDASIAAMRREDKGGDCEFDLTRTGLRLFPCAFGGRLCKGSEKYFHSYYGECFAFRHGINKNRHILFARPFTGIGDCIAMKFILSYTGDNPVINRLLMELLGWWFTLFHRPNLMVEDADYFSRLGADLHIDPLLWNYTRIANDDYRNHPPAAMGTTVENENLPNFRGKRTKVTKIDSTTGNNNNEVVHHTTSVTNIPVLFVKHNNPAPSGTLHHTACASAAYQILHHDWAIYRFTSGHFFSNILYDKIPFVVRIGIDPDYHGRDMMKTYGEVETILDSAIELMTYIRSSNPMRLQGYYISAPPLLETDRQLEFMKTQSSIIELMRPKCLLQCFVLEIPSMFHKRIISQFITSVESDGWHITNENIWFPEIGDCIDDNSRFVIGVHIGLQGKPTTINIVRPPLQHPSIEEHIYEPFETIEYAISELPKANKHGDDEKYAIIPPANQINTNKDGSQILGHLINKGPRPITLIGTMIFRRDKPAPALGLNNYNPFRRLFGIQFESRTTSGIHTRTISTYEYCKCWNMEKNLLVIFAKDTQKLNLLESAVPHKTSKMIMQSIHETLLEIKMKNSNFNDTAPQAASAATAYSFISGSTSTTLPSNDTWLKAYENDKETKMILDMIINPGLMTKTNMESIHYVYRQPLRSSNIIAINGMLYIREATDIAGNYMQLQIVPASLRNIVFIAFHANPIGCHFDTYHTFHRIRLRYHWPHLHTYISHLINKCAGCKLANARIRKSATLVYSFPIDEPMKVGHADVYSVGTEQGFDGAKCFMNFLCGMTGYAVSEPLRQDEVNSTGFAKALMRIMLRHGLSHTIVIDKDSKFRSTFEKTINLLEINLHVASGGNHDAVLTERFHVFLNKALTTFCNERDSTRVAEEGILLCCYGWNSAPIIGTDISRSLLVMGREFKFPIEYTASKYTNLNPSIASIETFAAQQEMLFSKCHEIFRILIQEHRAMHREYINSRRPDPLIFNIGDYVFARRSVKSDKKKGRVGKVMIKHTGPWMITEKLHGASYRLEHCRTKIIDKKHASQLSPCPENLTPYPPLSGPDQSYSQLNRNIKKNPFIEAGITSYDPASPWPSKSEDLPSDNDTQTLFCALTRVVPTAVRFPTLAELNDEMEGVHTNLDSDALPQQSKPPVTHEIESGVLTGEKTSINIQSKSSSLSLYGAPSITEQPQLKSTPSLTDIVTSIIKSNNKLFFVNYQNPHTSYREWKLCQVDLDKTFADNPQAITNGKFYFNFFILHPDDATFNSANQRYWTEYHELKGRFAIAQNYHLIKLTANTAEYCKDKKLQAFSQWLFIHHEDVFLHGPFEFATINGRKTRDRISISDWEVLSSKKHKYDNKAPPLKQKSYSYSYHVGTQYHIIQQDPSVEARMNAVAMYNYIHEDK